MSDGIPIELMVAAAGGDSFAQFDVGVKYLRGDGVAQDYTNAREWFLKAAEQGHARAKYNLGSMSLQGIGSPVDPAAALEWYGSAFDDSDTHLLYEMAVLVTSQDEKLHAWPFAVKCFKAAADGGHAKSQVVLGKRLLSGEGIEPNLELGQHYIAEAAKQGEPTALWLMAKIYEEGFGREPDLVQATYLYYLAALEGHPEAEKEGRSLAEKLTPEQQEEAGARIEKTIERLKQQAALKKSDSADGGRLSN